jgi:uncharacterized protein (TIGR00290 family)
MVKNCRFQKTLVSWSSGKDSAWALHHLLQKKDIHVHGLFTVVNEHYQRVPMHATRLELVRQQANKLQLPLKIITLPHACDSQTYNQIMKNFISEACLDEVDSIVYGDLFLTDVRAHREELLKDKGITPLFPLWGIPTVALARDMISQGLCAYVTCVDANKLSADFAGRLYDDSFLDDLPSDVDPCGENGEFHTFVFYAPPFTAPLSICLGDKIERDGFVFVDVVNK